MTKNTKAEEDRQHRATVEALRKQRAAPWTFRAQGRTIEIRSAGWGGIAWISPRADSNKGIPSREDREAAALIVRAVNAHAVLIEKLRDIKGMISEERHYADLGLADAIDDLNSIRELADDALRAAGEKV